MARRMPERSGSLSVVTVVFEAEVPLLELQARSIARHVPDGVFDEILVIDNSRRGLPEHARRRIRDELGDHADRLAFASRADLGPTAADASGWRTQQSLKLMAARRLAADHYVVLDAKNHFIRSTTRTDFLDPVTGLPHGGLHSFVEHPLRPQLELVAYGLGLDPAATVERFTATVPPIVLDRRVVDDLVTDVGRGDADRFPGEFERSGYTEFFLYSAWQVARGIRSREGPAASAHRASRSRRRRAPIARRYTTRKRRMNRSASALDGKRPCSAQNAVSSSTAS